MDIGHVQALVQRLTDRQLAHEIAQPSGIAPPNVLAYEMQRRSMMRSVGASTGPEPGQQMQGYGGPGYAMGGFVGYADGGDVDGGGDMYADANPQPQMPRTAAEWRNYGNPTARFNEAIPSVLKAAGITGDALTLPEALKSSQQYVPDRTSPAIAEMVKSQQDALNQYKSQMKGRGLMAMGLAMMQSHTPNFMQALGAGGEAGLATQDQINAQSRGLMQGVMQGKIAQAQAQAQNDAARTQMATGLYSSDQARRTAAMSDAYRMADTQTRYASANATDIDRMEQARSHDAMEQQIAAAQNATTLAAARVRASNSGAFDTKDLLDATDNAYKSIKEMYYTKDGHPNTSVLKGLRAPTDPEMREQAQALVAKQLMGTGITPPGSYMTALMKHNPELFRQSAPVNTTNGAPAIPNLTDLAGYAPPRPATVGASPNAATAHPYTPLTFPAGGGYYAPSAQRAPAPPMRRGIAQPVEDPGYISDTYRP